jgi:hypothetical protein
MTEDRELPQVQVAVILTRTAGSDDDHRGAVCGGIIRGLYVSASMPALAPP